MNGRLKDKVAIITGGSRGIGRGIASVFSKEGSRVIIASRDPKAGQNIVTEIIDSGGEAVFVQTDVSVENDTLNMARTTIEKYGRIDRYIVPQRRSIFYSTFR